MDRAPLIVTALLPAALQARAQALRRTHYPPQDNRVPAHVTLVRALPGMVAQEARERLATLGRQGPPEARLAGLLDLGTGTALAIDSPALLDLRETILERFHGLTGLADEAIPRLHATIQNKVPRAEARALQAQLGTAPWLTDRFHFRGLALHRYEAGFWTDLGEWSFRGSR